MTKLLLTLLFTVTSTVIFAQEEGIAEKINKEFQPLADKWGGFVFYSVEVSEGVYIPLVVVLLLLAGLIFTVLFKFVNVGKLPISINILKGKYDDLDDEYVKAGKQKEGEVSHFQALTSALSGTVGLGNISGVAVALSLGGPGATFWMIIAGLLGMSSKFVECTLGVKYRDVCKDGKVYGGPMYYLKKGLADVGKGTLGKILAPMFAILVVGGSFGGGNMFQANQAAQQFTDMAGLKSPTYSFIFGIVMAVLVGVVIIGGIKRIGSFTEKIVPFMVGVYLVAAIVILVVNYSHIGNAFGQIFNGAFSPEGITGGFLGVLIQGFKRAAFSNEAGVGSAAIAHSAVKTKYPVSEGLVALLEPFIDTVIVCTMTALVIIIANSDGSIMTYGMKSPDGVLATSKAFASVLPWFTYILTLAVVLFAFSTILSWSYYGLQGWMFLFGRSKPVIYVYKILFCTFTIVGSSVSLGAVTDFSDAMIFAMAVPNIIGMFFLYPKVKEELNRYLEAVKGVK
ncbi:MAG: alanine:cation symporter family protein [Tenacibaculum sp.]|nr:alanine:cation symporter family protein [Tenacibaculum sp.]